MSAWLSLERCKRQMTAVDLAVKLAWDCGDAVLDRGDVMFGTFSGCQNGTLSGEDGDTVMMCFRGCSRTF